VTDTDHLGPPSLHLERTVCASARTNSDLCFWVLTSPDDDLERTMCASARTNSDLCFWVLTSPEDDLERTMCASARTNSDLCFGVLTSQTVHGWGLIAIHHEPYVRSTIDRTFDPLQTVRSRRYGPYVRDTNWCRTFELLWTVRSIH